MQITPKVTDKFSFGTLYVLVALITLWAGFRLVDQGWQVRFFKDYLLQWETALQTFSAQYGRWPVFSGINHVEYMDTLVRQMKYAGVTFPDSNTPTAYRYRIEYFGSKDENIFVLCFHDRIILYGISGNTLGKLDKMIDKHSDLIRGRVSGRPGKNSKTFIGMWQL
jgi:hypothetical protein